MLLYCLESINPKVLNAGNQKMFFLQNLQCEIVTNQDVLKNKKQADC